MNKFPKPNMPRPVPPPSEEHPKTSSIDGYDTVSQILCATLKPEMLDDVRVIKFIDSYVNCRSAAQAAQEVGISGATASKWRNDPYINNCIIKLTNLSAVKYGFDAEEVLQRVKEIANVDPGVFRNEDGSYKSNINDIPPEARRAIKKFKVKNTWDYDVNGIKTITGEIIEVEFWDKVKTVELLGREKGLFKETHKVEYDVTSNMKDLLLASVNRAEESAKEAREIRDAAIDVTPTKDQDETK